MPIPPGGGGGSGCIPIMPPTPCTGAAPSPIGAAAAYPPLPAPPLPPLAVEGGGNAPRPTPRATPCPPADEAAAATLPGGGGPSTATLATFSPRNMIRPSVRFSTRSSIIALPPAAFLVVVAAFFFACRYSSASTSTKFKCLSKARNVPTIVLPSTNDTRSRCSMYRNNFDPLLPVGIMWRFILIIRRRGWGIGEMMYDWGDDVVGGIV